MAQLWKQRGKEILASWIDLIREEGKNVTKWEYDFIDSIANQLEGKGQLTEKQENVLEDIYAKRT